MTLDKPTCATCEHWKPRDFVLTELTAPCNAERDDFGEVVPDLDYGNCNCGKIVYLRRKIDCPKDGAAYWDFEQYAAGFKTGPDFGCVHHSPKPEPSFKEVLAAYAEILRVEPARLPERNNTRWDQMNEFLGQEPCAQSNPGFWPGAV